MHTSLAQNLSETPNTMIVRIKLMGVLKAKTPPDEQLNLEDGATIDGVSGTDGIDVTNASLGSVFPKGVFVAQDTLNPGANQNYKLLILHL